MAVLRILTYGDERLCVPSRPVEQLTPELQELIADMADTMYAASGVGLAAPQVGVSLRVAVVDAEQRSEGDRQEQRSWRVYINLQIVWTSDEDAAMAEGCLSIPGIEAELYRPSRIRVRYRDEQWQEHEVEADGLLARALQHENDHLDGVLFVDRLNLAKRQTLAGQLSRLRQERETIYVPASLADKR